MRESQRELNHDRAPDYAIVHDEDFNGAEVVLDEEGSIQSVGRRTQSESFLPVDSIGAEEFATPLRVAGEVKRMLKNRGLESEQIHQIAALLNRDGL